MHSRIHDTPTYIRASRAYTYKHACMQKHKTLPSYMSWTDIKHGIRVSSAEDTQRSIYTHTRILQLHISRSLSKLPFSSTAVCQLLLFHSPPSFCSVSDGAIKNRSKSSCN